MKLSELNYEDIGILKGSKYQNFKRFIVTRRVSEDRASGHTEIQYEETSIQDTFLWDVCNPEVEYIGKGQVIPRQVIFMTTKCHHQKEHNNDCRSNQ
jgi:hypothetical protein